MKGTMSAMLRRDVDSTVRQAKELSEQCDEADSLKSRLPFQRYFKATLPLFKRHLSGTPGGKPPEVPSV